MSGKLRPGRCLALLLAAALLAALPAGCGAGNTVPPVEAPQPVRDEAAAEPAEAAPEEATEAAPADETSDSSRTVPTADDGLLIQFYHLPALDNQWGDCTYFEFADGTNMLVDCGTPAAGEIIAADLVSRGITKLDILVITHFHADHVGGYKHLAAQLDIGQIYSGGYAAAQFAWVEEDIAARGIPYRRLTAGDEFTFGDAAANVLWPPADLVAEDPALDAADENCVIDTNNRSLVFRLDYDGVSVLMTADIYKQAQRDILAAYAGDLQVLDADIEKIPHHGYDNAVNADFIQAVSPAYAVMIGNHVMTNVAYRLYTNIGCTGYATWMNGNVYVVIENGHYEVIPDSPEIRDYYK